MATYQQYRRYRKEPADPRLRVGKVVLILVAFVFIYLISRAIFGGGSETDTNTPVNEAATNISGTSNENTNGVNTNGTISNSVNATNTAVSASGKIFSVADACTGALSRGKSSEKNIALTFNVGTTKEGSIEAVLTALTNAGVPAAFFITGDVATGNAELVTKISSAGFPIYNFGNSLVHFTDLPEDGITEQLTEAETSISAVTNKSTKPFFRPPYGSVDADVVAASKAAGWCPVTWTVDALDWSSESTATSSQERVLSKAANGAIILMQGGNSITAEILAPVIAGLKSQGYTLVDLPALFAGS